jgi:hypothetical protein
MMGKVLGRSRLQHCHAAREAGRTAPIALMICREIRQAARQEWHQLSRAGMANGG